MTLEELLKANGVNDEAVAAIIAGMKENKIFTASEENLDIRYGKLKTDHDALVAQHGEATTLIEQLKKGTKGNEELQGKVTAYETQVADLQKELQDTKIKSAVKVALLAEKCDDIEYITYVIEKNLKEQGKSLELDDNENIKGWDDLLSGVKTQQPSHFEKKGDPRIEPLPLPKPDDNKPGLTKEEFDKMGYNSRVKLKAEQPELYANMMKG